MLRAAVALLCAALTAPAQAQQQVYAVTWGSAELGFVTYDPAPRTGKDARLRSDLRDTPLGVMDGTFDSTSRSTPQNESIYHATSESAAKTRISMIGLTASGKATAASVTPAKDITDFTQPENIPAPVQNPVQAFAGLVSGATCPQTAFRIYDARRVSEVTPTSATTTGSVLTCMMEYHVILGPGHLRPLSLKYVSITLEFDPAVAKTGPGRISLRSGPFRLLLTRVVPK